MGKAKSIIVKPISAANASRIIKRLHYSGKVVQNSQLHLGVFLDGKCGGCLSFGPSMDKSKIQGLVTGTTWNGFIELNRMAIADWMPRNGESRAIGLSIRFIKHNYPHIKWIVSYADGTQCGDGTIYRASNFILTGIKPNKTILKFPTGDVFAAMTLEANYSTPPVVELCKKMGIDSRYRTRAAWVKLGAEYIKGFMLRYMYFIDKSARELLTVPVIPFSAKDVFVGNLIIFAKPHVPVCIRFNL